MFLYFYKVQNELPWWVQSTLTSKSLHTFADKIHTNSTPAKRVLSWNTYILLKSNGCQASTFQVINVQQNPQGSDPQNRTMTRSLIYTSHALGNIKPKKISKMIVYLEKIFHLHTAHRHIHINILVNEQVKQTKRDQPHSSIHQQSKVSVTWEKKLVTIECTETCRHQHINEQVKHLHQHINYEQVKQKKR